MTGVLNVRVVLSLCIKCVLIIVQTFSLYDIFLYDQLWKLCFADKGILIQEQGIRLLAATMILYINYVFNIVFHNG